MDASYSVTLTLTNGDPVHLSEVTDADAAALENLITADTRRTVTVDTPHGPRTFRADDVTIVDARAASRS
ncbi:hypothetical protein AB0B94_31005 [Micromonospora sp. NPDC048986]|uniref:hypothetical protein n=1 Tax=Micromonospora sp. NPDC048986 TaxID=3155644 RepID=UPI0033C52C5D